MAQQYNQFTGTGDADNTLDGYFKVRYGKLKVLLPQMFKCQRAIPFRSSKLVGDNYQEPVLLTQEHGFAYAKADEDAFELAEAVAAETKRALVEAYQYMLRTRIGVKAVARSKTSKQAFGDVYDRVVKNMWLSARKRTEIEILHGQNGLGVGEVGAVTTGASGTVTITLATWAAGIWAGMENARIQFFLTNAHHETGALNHSTITGINLDTRVITCDNVPTNAAVGDQVWLGTKLSSGTFVGQHGTGGSNSALGIHGITTSTGTLFTINAGTYSLWKPSTYAVGSAQLTFAKVNKAVVKLITKGLDETLTLLVNPNTWADLLADEVATRAYDQGAFGGGKRIDVGADGIMFHTQSGTVKIQASTYVMEGYAYLFSPALFERIGSTDITFELLGRPDHFFHDVADNAGFELRLYSDQAVFTDQPGKSLAFTGIVNGT